MRKETGNTARLAATFGDRRGTEVRWANSGDHWPGYAGNMTLRRGYWVGDDRRQDWVGLRKSDVVAEATDRGVMDEDGEPVIQWHGLASLSPGRFNYDQMTARAT